MATLAARLLRYARAGDIVIANRSAERGQALAADVGGRFAPLAALPTELPRLDMLVAAATVPGYLVSRALLDDLPGRATPLVALDLGVPRNIDPACGALPGYELHCVDDLEPLVSERRAGYGQEIAKVEALVDDAVDAFCDWWQARAVVPTITALRERAEAVRQLELERATRKLGHLSERDRAVVEALSVGIVNKLLHEPVTRLKSADVLARDQAQRLVCELFGIEDGRDPKAVTIE
jgi:glutamyl-tRNA reductase